MISNLLAPPVPVMFHIVAPDVALMANAFFHQQIGQAMGIVQALVFPGTLPANQSQVGVAANML